jgi:hypothetical protein
MNMKPNPYQSTIKKIHDAAATPDGIRYLRNGLSLYDEESSVFEANWKVSEIVNPDGSVSIRRKILNRDGSQIITQEEYPYLSGNLPNKIFSKKTVIPPLQRCDSDSSMSSIATVKTKGSSKKYSPDRSNISKPTLRKQWRTPPRKNENLQWSQTDDSDSTDMSYLISSDKSSTFNSTAGTMHFTEPMVSRSDYVHNWLLDDENSGQHDWPYHSRPMNPVPFEDIEQVDSKSRISKSVAFTNGISNNSMGYPEYDMSTLHSHNIASVDSPTSERPDTATAFRFKTRPTGERDRSLSTVGSEKQPGQSSQTCVVTVVKRGPSDKLGIHVGLKQLVCGIRLVVSRVSPDGKFVNKPIARGDIVCSINGISFLEDPNTDDALGEYTMTFHEFAPLLLCCNSDVSCAYCFVRTRT